MTGTQHCRAVEIDPALLEDGDVEMLQDLIVSAINLAQEKAAETGQTNVWAPSPAVLPE